MRLIPEPGIPGSGIPGKFKQKRRPRVGAAHGFNDFTSMSVIAIIPNTHSKATTHEKGNAKISQIPTAHQLKISAA